MKKLFFLFIILFIFTGCSIYPEETFAVATVANQPISPANIKTPTSSDKKLSKTTSKTASKSTKKIIKKKKRTKKKEKLIAVPPLITLETAPHSPKPGVKAKKKSTATKKSTTKVVAKKKV